MTTVEIIGIHCFSQVKVNHASDVLLITGPVLYNIVRTAFHFSPNPQLQSVVKKIRKFQIEGPFTKYMTSTFQTFQGPESQKETK